MRSDRGTFSINFEVRGDQNTPLVVLVPGLGEQIGSVEFPEEDRELLVSLGCRVCVMDNRDNGLSTPTNSDVAPYSVLDMADDVAAVIDACGAQRAHVVGASMGGFIARWTAIRHPQAVSAVTVLMSGSGADHGQDAPQVSPEVIARLWDGLAVHRERGDALDALLDLWRWLWADMSTFDEHWVRTRLEYAYNRSYRPDGVGRNLMAFAGAPSLWDAQTTIGCPTLIVHGDADPVFPIDHGIAIADQVADARLLIVPQMGHAIPTERWTELAPELVALAS